MRLPGRDVLVDAVTGDVLILTLVGLWRCGSRECGSFVLAARVASFASVWRIGVTFRRNRSAGELRHNGSAQKTLSFRRPT
jgi:hypothetical protein